jgi:L-fuconolactonase
MQNWKPADLTSYLATVLDAFGPERVMYGSDTPVVQLAERHEHWLNVLLTFLQKAVPRQVDAIMAANARKFYRL